MYITKFYAKKINENFLDLYSYILTLCRNNLYVSVYKNRPNPIRYIRLAYELEFPRPKHRLEDL